MQARQRRLHSNAYKKQRPDAKSKATQMSKSSKRKLQIPPSQENSTSPAQKRRLLSAINLASRFLHPNPAFHHFCPPYLFIFSLSLSLYLCSADKERSQTRKGPMQTAKGDTDADAQRVKK